MEMEANIAVNQAKIKPTPSASRSNLKLSIGGIAKGTGEFGNASYREEHQKTASGVGLDSQTPWTLFKQSSYGRIIEFTSKRAFAGKH